MTGAIVYDYQALADGVRQMQNANQNIEQNVTALNQQVQSLMDSFDGQTATQYNQCADRIFRKLRESNEVLNQISVNLNRNSNNMNDADRSTASTFNF
ncbi:WXG100 family type VII secretion target [Lentzea atacamensis]|uniref:ESAT-6-like protein n=1 Tax=Lentzea atacamensis TaxID=531938 RepID=A0A316HWS7_9PSEU|nr:WXG100 family type VII secretion target [Lentzea atacamensis]PWK85547.1 WXG100 family type VII secretion target [Lentzea atacamensis]RAS66948.1 WXG100 family type VII secretion target [Lentzea atacamensis]